ncbi:MAG: hypothetical protein IH595_04565 [Bacteroidales bacterium]|nr:hypothetical protein [Bacteroidales bacterium]
MEMTISRSAQTFSGREKGKDLPARSKTTSKSIRYDPENCKYHGAKGFCLQARGKDEREKSI